MSTLGRVCAATAFVTFALTVASGQELKELLASSPAYRPEQHVSGMIRIWGHGNRSRDFVGDLVNSWEEGFRKYQPEVTFETELRGNASAIGGLYTGAADVAFLGREIWPIEADGYEQGLGYKPFQVSAATGSLEDRYHDFALAIFVHSDNPLSKLTLAQLDAIFGADHKRGPKNIRAWGELGMTGEWTNKPINLYGYEIDRDFSQFFEQAVLAGSRKWNCNFREIADQRNPDGSVTDAGRRILDALTKDRYGMAFSSLAYKDSMIKAIALAREEGGAYYSVTKEAVIKQKYPLTRTPYMFVNRPPGQPVDPKVKEFLRYVLSREGQELVIRDGGYLPLSSEALRKQLEKLQ
jgi:phosphate transport system substrate-binding protein